MLSFDHKTMVTACVYLCALVSPIDEKKKRTNQPADLFLYLIFFPKFIIILQSKYGKRNAGLEWL